jgi:adenylate kinase family enzyme
VAVRALRPWPSLLILGPTGSGKTPLGDEFERHGLGGRGCVHFDFGANLRSLAAAPDAAEWLSDSEIAGIRESLATGALFEHRDMPLILKIVDRFAGVRGIGPGSLLVLNGLPRHEEQAKALAARVAVISVVRLEASAAVVLERLRLDPGADRAARVDDSLEAVERRLADYHARTLPLVAFYRDLGAPTRVIPVTATMTAAEMYDSLVRMIGGAGGGGSP